MKKIISGQILSTGLLLKEPIFKEEDIYQTTDPYTKILRTIFVQRGVTYGDLREAIVTSGESIGLDKKKATENWSNSKKNIKNDHLTSKMINWLFAVFGWRVKEVEFVIEEQDRDDETYKIKL